MNDERQENGHCARFASYVGRAGVIGAEGGYVLADSPTATDYTPNTTFQWNSTGANNTIHRSSSGNYTVTLPGQSFVGGTLEVTADGFGNEYCKVQSWGPSGSNQLVRVACFTPSGIATDAMFTLVFSNRSPNGTGSYTYAWASDPNAASYTPSSTYQRGFIAGDGAVNGGRVTSPLVSITHNTTGNYSVHFPQMSDSGDSFGKSNVKVTGYGFDNTTCKVLGWGGSGDGGDASVACHDPFGNPTNALFTITYSSTQFIIG